jgi:glycine cleavage system aminomethyltransferase T
VRIVVDGQPVEFQSGDTVALAALRSGQHPARGGTLCLAGDCGNCVASVDGVPWVRTCQTPAKPGLVVTRHPEVGHPSTTGPDSAAEIAVHRQQADFVVVGGGASGLAAVEKATAHGHTVTLLDTALGDEVVGVFAGPSLVVRRPDGIHHLHAHKVILATGAAELQPACPGNLLRGIYTLGAAAKAQAAGVFLGRTVTVGRELIRFEGTDTLEAVVVAAPDGERRIECDTAIVALGRSPRDLLARMVPGMDVRIVGPAAEAFELPACPTAGVVCPCSKTTVEDLQGGWDRGFHEVELLKRSTLCGTGTCQGSVCTPHLRAFVADRSGEPALPFTGRPAARQITMAEAAAGFHLDPTRRGALHDEHLALGANMDRFGGWWRPWNYGDPVAEYWAVREGVSLGDVSTLGKLVVSGPDAVEALERIYPNHVHDIKAGRSRYVLILNERGHLIDDGMIVRESDTRFVLTFTSGGASAAEMWTRDWIETWGLDVRVMDRTASLGAINVTGPLAGELMQRAGIAEPPKFLQHRHLTVAGVPCHVMRLSFTGEASFELHHARSRSVELWRALMELGRDLGIRPHGLQALFGMRLEKGHIIIGMDTELDTTPRRVHMDWAIKMEKADFLGKAALARTAELPDERRLFGFTMDGEAPIEGTPIIHEGRVMGNVTSTWTSPLLGKAVMLGWLKYTPWPTTVTIDGREAHVTDTPFYDKEGARARM